MSDSIRVKVDVTNPGQFFACCGLLELASRWRKDSVVGWFDSSNHSFFIQSDSTELRLSLQDLIQEASGVEIKSDLSSAESDMLKSLNAQKRELKKSKQSLPNEDEAKRKRLGTLVRSGPITLLKPFDIRLDWWNSDDEDVPKTWAGSQEIGRIAGASRGAAISAFSDDSPFDRGVVVREVDDDQQESDEDGDSETDATSGKSGSKVEPFYFDSRRGEKPFARDIGFSPNKLKMTTAAFPAVEFLCLIGLQRCRPRPASVPRVFDYFTWSVPLSVSVLPVAVVGLLPGVGAEGYRFENAFRTDQRKHKAFSPAIPLPRRLS